MLFVVVAKGCPCGCRRPRVEGAGVGLHDRAAAEGRAAIATVCRGGVHRKVDAALR